MRSSQIQLPLPGYHHLVKKDLFIFVIKIVGKTLKDLKRVKCYIKREMKSENEFCARIKTWSNNKFCKHTVQKFPWYFKPLLWILYHLKYKTIVFLVKFWSQNEKLEVCKMTLQLLRNHNRSLEICNIVKWSRGK